MAYSSIVKPTDYFNIKLTTGTGSSQAVTGLGFQPDLIWGKRRDSTGNHSWFDAVRGITKGLESNSTGAEFTSTDYYSSFDSDGFTIAAGSSGAGNGSSQTAVQWCWLGANGTASNGNGNITSTVSANTTAGFSIVTFTGNGSNSQTVGHGLGVAPELIILKARGQGTYGWITYDAINEEGRYLTLNNNNAVTVDSGMWSNTAPTSSVFSLSNGGNTAITNPSGVTMVCYCFHSVKGYSKIGSYIGGGDPFVYLGFKPSWIIFKNKNDSENWRIVDNKRDTDNPVVQHLFSNSNAAEASGTSYSDFIDFLSNGFKIRSGSGEIDGSGDRIIYMAFAENPFVANDSGTAVPVVAR